MTALAPLVTLGVLALAAAGVDRLVPFAPEGGRSRPALLALAALSAAYVATALSWAGALGSLGAATILVRRRGTPSASASAPPSAWAWALPGVLALLVLPALLRPAWPLYWDGFVWLAKARVAWPWPGRLVAAALAGGDARVIPPGYPIFDPLAAAWLGRAGTPGAVTAGAAAFEALVTTLFVTTQWDAPGTDRTRAGRVVVTALLLASCPLVWVHLRGLYVDLPVGMLAATLALLLFEEDARAAPLVVVVALVGLKDEGLAHAGAVCLVAALRAARERSRPLLGTATTCAGAAAVAFGAWRLRLASAGTADVDHALRLPNSSRLLSLASLIGSHLADLTSWGALWMLAGGAVLAALVFPSRASRRARWLAATLVAQAGALLLGVACGPERVMAFAREGTLVNRLLVQLVPMAVLAVGAWLCPDA